MKHFIIKNFDFRSKSKLRLLSTLLIICCFTTTWGQSTFYVSPNGDDNNPGTFDRPWGTWNEALNNTKIQPGDTVYFRGGVYYHTGIEGGYGWKCSRIGSENKYVHYFNYPGEKPILDCENVKARWGSGTLNYPLYTKKLYYVHFKGLTVRNVWQDDGADECTAWQFGGDYIIVENCNVYNVHGGGFQTDNCDNTYFINCDAWDCCDSLTTVPASNPVPGNDGTGFLDGNRYNTKGTVKYINCRAWNCGDQGFSTGSIGKTIYEGCWSFKNGQLEGGGHGFKMGWVTTIDEDVVNRVYKNCISAFNMYYGFTSNDQGYDCGAFEVYNNIAYMNGYVPGDNKQSKGFCIYNTNDTDRRELRRVYRNNISYKNETGEMFIQKGASYTHSHNSWDLDINISDNDFISIDSTGLSGPRNKDGSLPKMNFLKLSSNSKLIDAGINVGMSYNKSAPDLGFAEYTENTSSERELEVLSHSQSNDGNTVNIKYYAPENGTVKIVVSDKNGNSVLTNNHSASTGSNSVNVNLSSLDIGTYTITLNDNVSSDSFQITKKEDENTIKFMVEKSFPNPTPDLFVIQYSCPEVAYIPIKVYHESGQLVLSLNTLSRVGLNKVVVNLSGLEVGIYKIELNYKDLSISVNTTKTQYENQ